NANAEAILLTDLARLGDPGPAAARLPELAACQGEWPPARQKFAAALAADDPTQLLAAAEDMQRIRAHLLWAEAATAAAPPLRRAGKTGAAAAADQQAATAIAECEGAKTPMLTPATTAARITARQRDIALRAAKGASSQDIARQLHLSVRTVENHLQQIYIRL